MSVIHRAHSVRNVAVTLRGRAPLLHLGAGQVLVMSASGGIVHMRLFMVDRNAQLGRAGD
jgi:hypothetical protein